jgi:CheY-like chemotaxis protein
LDAVVLAHDDVVFISNKAILKGLFDAAPRCARSARAIGKLGMHAGHQNGGNRMKWLYNLKLRTKLLAGFFMVAVVAVTVGLISIQKVHQLNAADTFMYEKMTLGLFYVDKMRENYQRSLIDGRDCMFADSAEERSRACEALLKFGTKQSEAEEDYAQTFISESDREVLDESKQKRQAYMRYFPQFKALVDSGRLKEAKDYFFGDMRMASDEYLEVLDKIKRLNVDQAKMQSDANTQLANNVSRLLTIIMVAGGLVAFGLGILLSKIVQGQLGADPAEVKDLASRVAVGDVSMVIDLSGKRPDSLLAAMSKMVETIKTLVADTNMLSKAGLEGKLATRVDATRRQGEFRNIVEGINDTLDAVIGPLNIAANFVDRISKGDMPPPIAESFSGDFNILRSNLNTLVLTLARINEEGRQRDWLKNGMNELNVFMRGEQKANEMADKVLTFLSEYLKAGAGTFYMYDEKGKALVLAAAYAFTRRKNLSDQFQLGEGLIGQAAREKKMICLSNIPPDYLQISSALGEAVPNNIVAIPLIHNDQLVGALELGTFKPFSDQELDFLNQAIEGIAIGLGVSHSRQRINELLEQTQQQTEELRVQQEELQQTNEDLEERAEMLEQQGKQIQAKNLEIEAASAELGRKAQEIEKVSAYKSQFLANMSHELRTPLNSMMILSSLLMENKEGTLSDKQKEFAATINNAGKDLLNLINDILDLAKVEAGRLELLFEDVEVAVFCETLEGLFRQQAEQKELGFSITVEDSAPKTIRIDEQRTRQILKNLLSNAFKFTEKGSVNLNVSAPAGPANPLSVPAIAFSVRDTGIGIEKEKHELVFQAFQQADDSTSRKFGGTGLGLSISLQLARRVGGYIKLESEKGKGSVFTLYLPIAGKVSDEETVTPPVLRKSQTEEPSDERLPVQETGGLPRPLPDDRDALKKGDKSILVIEDDLNFAKILMTMVREKGFGCVVAADGPSGIRLADLYQPSAVILDVLLPGMDGWGVMRSLKDNPATRHIPVHFITCVDERQKGLSMGAVGFYTKPVTPEQLEEAFENIEESVAKTLRQLLIIEDDRSEAESMSKLLEARNLEISVAATGAEAIDLLGRKPVDCIVLDIGLPDMSGFELLEHIRRADKLRSIPVIIHTGRDLSHEEDLKLQHYAKSIIIKGAKGPERLLNEVTLFLHMVENELPREKQQMIRAALDKEAMLEGKKVLLVDDDMRNVFSLSSILTDKNMVVIEAENGREALDRINEHPDVNIVLMDIMMPEMNGYDAMCQIRLDPRFKDLPVIAMTAKAMAGDREKCIQAGASDYISKPLDTEKLLSLIRVWLYRQT